MLLFSHFYKDYEDEDDNDNDDGDDGDGVEDDGSDDGDDDDKHFFQEKFEKNLKQLESRLIPSSCSCKYSGNMY